MAVCCSLQKKSRIIFHCGHDSLGNSAYRGHTNLSRYITYFRCARLRALACCFSNAAGAAVLSAQLVKVKMLHIDTAPSQR